MALVRLAADYAARANTSIIAFTVDHGLRPASAEEAEKVAAWCAKAGVPHRVLTWKGPKPTSGLQAAARAARYRLLSSACSKEGCDALLTAHSMDDQAETLFMRLRRGAGVRGLASMPDETLIAAGAGPAIRLLRPLLPFSRSALTATARAAGQTYIDDPSNDDPQFERVRTRALLAALAENELLSGEALYRSAEKLRDAEIRLRRQEEELFDMLGGCFYGWGGASLDRAENLPGFGGLASRLIHAVSGEDYAPGDEASRDAVMQAKVSGGATIGGVLIRPWKDRIWFLREPAALFGRTGVAPMEPVELDAPLIWDGRYILEAAAGAASLEIAPLGDGKRLGAKAAIFNGPPEAFASLPGIFMEDALIAVPPLPFMSDKNIRARSLVKERFLGKIIRF